MPSRQSISRAIQWHRWLPVVVFTGLGLFTLVVTVVRAAQGRWSQAVAGAAFTIGCLLAAAGFAWWLRRTADGPAYMRRLPPEIRNDPDRRREAWRTAWQTRVASWVFLTLALAGAIWGIALQRWSTVLWSAIAVAGFTRVLWTVYGPTRPRS